MEWLSEGANSWQMTAATLVGLMSVPGLVVLYGGVMQKRWSVNSMMMAFVAFAIVLVLWVLVGFKMGFGEPVHAISDSGFFGNFIGKPGSILNSNELLKQAHIPELAEEEFLFPQSTLAYFQIVFAAITPILMLGSVLGASTSRPGSRSSPSGPCSSTRSTPSSSGAAASSPSRVRSTTRAVT